MKRHPKGVGRGSRPWGAGSMAFAGALQLVCVSCQSDYRISLDEFLASTRGAPTTEQPAPTNAELVAMLNQRLGPYRVGPGDELTVQLTGRDGSALFPALAVRVRRGGDIDLPLVGAVSVAGKELEDVEAAIRSVYVPAVYNDAVCYVSLDRAEVANVLVVGAVSEGGLVPLYRHQRNLLFAVVGAGGVSEDASGQATLRRLREPGAERTFDLTDPAGLQAALTIDPLENGDIVHVHAAQPNTVFVGGLVNRPAPQSYPAGTKITVLQAIAAAAGLRTDVTPSEGTLIRRMPDGTDRHVKLDLDSMARGECPNILLAAGDVLWVPETFETQVQDFLNRNVFLRAGISVNYNVTGIEYLNRASAQSRQFGGSSLESAFDPFGFLSQNAVLGAINTRIPP